MIKKSLMLVGMVVSLVTINSAFAYQDSFTNNGCKKPRFKSFTPPHKAEVAPQSEISFTVSGYADPTTIEATAKKIPLKLNVENKGSFFEVTAKLPPELVNKYARINLFAGAPLGCVGKDGWLIKITD